MSSGETICHLPLPHNQRRSHKYQVPSVTASLTPVEMDEDDVCLLSTGSTLSASAEYMASVDMCVFRPRSGDADAGELSGMPEGIYLRVCFLETRAKNRQEGWDLGTTMYVCEEISPLSCVIGSTETAMRQLKLTGSNDGD